MFLRRLDLVGFKSFAPRTTTELLPGIVVVVGPNGSGKSNIADSVRWVLGEQSAKAVRARKPEEVIFAGSASRQPLGMAEVSLVLDNTDGSLPIEYAEVRVTRRLYRSGDSEYLLNGARVRLKDITQLLLHAGLSPDSYTVIGQGSIDELILQRPDERRVVFENAADIRRHQLRLNDTRSKLGSTEANLVRVQDVLAELTPHVRRLKGQADRAGRAETFRSELHDLLVRYFRARLIRAHADRRSAEAELTAATEAAERAEGETLSGEQAVHEVDRRLAGIEERFAELRPRAEALREQARVTERSLAVTRERIAGLAAQRSSLEADITRVKGTLERLAEEEQAAAGAAGRGPAPTPSTAAADERARPAAGDELAQRVEGLRAALAELSSSVAGLQRERARSVQELEAADRRVRDAEGRLTRTEQQLQSLQATLAVDQARQADRAQRLDALERTGTQLQQQAATFDEALQHARARLTAASEARRQSAGRLAEAGEALRKISQQADRLQGALAALGAEDLNRRDSDDLPADWVAVLHDLPVVGLAAELASRIRPIDLQLAGFLRRIVVLANDAAAREAHGRLSAHVEAGGPAWATLSMDGLLLAAPGEHPLEAAGDEGQSSLADWARQVRQLEAELGEAETGRRAAMAEVQAARDSVDDAEANQQSARVGLGEVEGRLAELRRAEAAARNELNQLRAEHERAARAAAQRSEERGRATTRAQATQAELATARAQRDALADVLSPIDQRLASATQQIDHLRLELATVEAEAGRREAERAAREALHARIKAEITANAATHEAAHLRLAQLDRLAEQLRQDATRLGRDLEAMQLELAPIESELQSTEQRRAESLGERQALEQGLGLVRAAERGAHELREARHVAAQRAADEVERLNSEINETAELEAETAGSAAWAEQLQLDLEHEPASVPGEVFDLDAARRRIATLQRELRAVGGVAESVIQEYRELSDRHDFLEHQSADLRAAMAELQTAAVELELHMRDRFAEVFSTIQAAFQECFQRLFGGGEARLVLTEPDDLLRTGIDIVARPPGKKLQGLLSLSGGERALTIVSLLFGLLKTNPSPFCVLDEVDAALDEANVQRFANLLGDFARQIQFIVVTHNRATMDTADAMYGVSMDGQGISHIFSVQPRVLAAAGHHE